ncbi:NAD(P)-binding domain-containing protein [Pseudochelatococcus sp. B33]
MSAPFPSALPIAVVGAGPVGLAAAAHLVGRGMPVRVYEAGSIVGANIRDWGHVRLFTPWRYCVDAEAVRLLARHGWRMPDGETVPTGHELVSNYLEPLADAPALSAAIEIRTRVTAIARHGIDKVVSRGRDGRPFVLVVETPEGERRDLARAVIDASGTWASPNPLGADGIAATGEAAFAERIAYGIPDVLGRDRPLYAGRTTLVVGAGHSAANVLLDLDRLSREAPETAIVWATRGTNLARVFGGGAADELPSRADLGTRTRRLIEHGRIRLVAGFAIRQVHEEAGRLIVEGETADGPQALGPVDRIVVCTGQRPDLAITRELRLELDPWLECARRLGPSIDPNMHSCGSVPPHGYRELSHPESGFYTVGVKSYGRAPTFLLLTGYEQARSVAAALSGDLAAADDVRLVLPETGVCTTQIADGPPVADGPSGASCCGGPETDSTPRIVENADTACCARDRCCAA